MSVVVWQYADARAVVHSRNIVPSFSTLHVGDDNVESIFRAHRRCLGAGPRLSAPMANIGERTVELLPVHSCAIRSLQLDKLEVGWPMRRIVEVVPDRWALARGLLMQPQQPAQ